MEGGREGVMVVDTFQLEFGGIAWTLNPDGTQLHELTE